MSPRRRQARLIGGLALVLSLVMVPLPAGAADPASEAVADDAVGFLAASQQADGGFEVAGFAGFETPDAVLAIAEAAQADDSWSTAEALAGVEVVATGGGLTGLDEVDDLAEGPPAPTAGLAAKLIVLVVAPLGLDPNDVDPSGDSPAAVDLEAAMLGGAAVDGSFGAFNATLYAAVAHPLVGRPVPAATVQLIRDGQQANGGWNFAGDPTGTDVDPDTTGLAVQALVAAGVDPAGEEISDALALLASVQQPDGSWTSFGQSNPNSTAMAVLAVAAAGWDPTSRCWRDAVLPSSAGAPYASPDAYLRGLQDATGRIVGPIDGDPPNTFGTSQAVQALLRQWLPVERADAQPCPEPPPLADLAIALTHPGDFTASGPGRYEVTVANAGPGPATGVTVVDELPIGLTFASVTGDGVTCQTTAVVTCSLTGALAAGESRGFALSVAVAADAPPLVTNVARVAAVEADPNPGNNRAEDDTVVQAVAVPPGDGPPGGGAPLAGSPVDTGAVVLSDMATAPAVAGATALARTGSESGDLAHRGLVLVGCGLLAVGLATVLRARWEEARA